jgi:hypothetical protein
MLELERLKVTVRVVDDVLVVTMPGTAFSITHCEDEHKSARSSFLPKRV